MKTNFKTLRVLAASAALVTSLCQQVQAVPITGTVDMSGTAFLDNTALGSATKATSFAFVTVGGLPTGSFTGTGGSSVSWSPFGWSPSSLPPTLWSYVSGLNTYSFVLSTVSVVSQNNFFLNLVGNGTLSIAGPGGYTPTAGTWSFTISNSSGDPHANFAFTFANSQTAAVPDGGLTLALLGFVLIGAEGLRRKLKSN